MNGVIHDCSHTDSDLSESLPFDVIMEKVFSEIQRIFSIVKPQRLVYIAVDGVAPRAKLNQQRSRRFRAARDRLIAMDAAAANLNRNITTDLIDVNAAAVAPPSVFDSNCITPGTEFMARLSVALRQFIEHMMRTQESWRPLTVHFSGSEVPGEGEHKIVSYIRKAKQSPDYLPNLRHCILGATYIYHFDNRISYQK
jgi:5'-3' exonuclease